ncbi:MAG: hypothetical protein QOK11_1036 [Pseudonocardiales bacterium]|jgi:uncharacterized protein (DUF983 family)|nr:hypothetical protein [Pseudonocardiales bacterium]
MGFAGGDDYRAALRRHRSWPATIALFVVATGGWFVFLGIFGTGLLIHLPLWAGIALSLALALVTVVMDAAHRLAGERRLLK